MTNRCKRCNGYYTEYEGSEELLCPVCNNSEFKQEIAKFAKKITDNWEKQHDTQALHPHR